MLALVVSNPPDQEDAEDAARSAAREQNLMESHVLGERLLIRGPHFQSSAVLCLAPTCSIGPGARSGLQLQHMLLGEQLQNSLNVSLKGGSSRQANPWCAGQRARAERFAAGEGGRAGSGDGGAGRSGDGGAGPSSSKGKGATGKKKPKAERKPGAGKAAAPVLARCSRGQMDPRCTCVICRKAQEQQVSAGCMARCSLRDG